MRLKKSALPEVIAAIRHGTMTLNEAIEQEYAKKKEALPASAHDERLKEFTPEQLALIEDYTKDQIIEVIKKIKTRLRTTPLRRLYLRKTSR